MRRRLDRTAHNRDLPLFRLGIFLLLITLPTLARQSEAKNAQPQEYQDKVNHLGWRINLSAIVAAYLDARAKETNDPSKKQAAREAARDLRSGMVRLDRQMLSLVERSKRAGKSIQVPATLHANDQITRFRNHPLHVKSPADDLRVLKKFIVRLRAGDRAQVTFLRKGKKQEIEVSFQQRPKELFTIMQVADLVPGDRTLVDKDVKGSGPTPKAYETLADPAKRRSGSQRDTALSYFKRAVQRSTGTGSDYDAACLTFLSMKSGVEDAKPLSAYLSKYANANTRKLPATEHLRAAEFLAQAMKDTTGTDSNKLELFFQAHLSEATALLQEDHAELRRVAKLVRYRLSNNKQMWGESSALATYELSRYRSNPTLGARVASTPNTFAGRYMKMAFDVHVKVAAQKSLSKLYVTALRLAKTTRGKTRAHVLAIAKRVQKAGKCSSCKRGKVDCPACDGKGRATITCPQCEGDGTYDEEQGGFGKYCKKCKRTGKLKNAPCGKCRKKGKLRCKKCDSGRWLWKTNAKASDIFTQSKCRSCRGSGSVFRRVARPCKDCFGFGIKLTPTSN